MMHLDDDALLLYAYDELDEPASTAAAQHLATCDACRAKLGAVDVTRAGLDIAFASPRAPRTAHRAPWLIPLALAAGAAALLISRGPGTGSAPAPDRPAWQSHIEASPTAGYLAGGAALMAIDSVLTNLEKGGRYVRN